MAEKHETDEELRKKMIVEQQNRRQSRVISSAQKLAKVRQSNGATRRSSPAVTATILAKHSLNLSSASTNNEIAFGLNFVGIYDGLHLPLDFSLGSAFSGDYNMGKFSLGMSW